MRHGLTRCLAALLLCLTFPSLASASVARVMGLNTPAEYVKGDYTGMYTFLSQVNRTGNLVWIEAGSSERGFGDQGVGAVLPNLFEGRTGVWSFNLRAEHPGLGQAWSRNLLGPSFNSNDRDFAGGGEAFDILWGHKLGSGNLGLRLHRTFQSTDDGTNTTEGSGTYSRNIMGYGVGYDFQLNPTNQVEMVVQYQQRTYESSPTDLSDDGSALLVVGRVMRTCANATVIPLVKYYAIDHSSLVSNVEVVDKSSGWQVGLASNWTLGAGDLFILGGQVASDKREDAADEQITRTYYPNVFAAIETYVNPWLTFRAGAHAAAFHSIKEEAGTTEATYKQADFSFNLGTSVKMGSLTFDAVLEPAFLQNPFAQLSGGSSAFYSNNYYKFRAAGGSPFSVAFPQVSATYTW